tara:strand:- start:106 stop:294 length:189 start_codon:yes stop_codon:yes gene_type:complete
LRGENIGKDLPLLPLWLRGSDVTARSKLGDGSRFQIVDISRAIRKNATHMNLHDCLRSLELL